MNSSDFSTIIGYFFQNPDILNTALTHSSFKNEAGCTSNERLEFLGDAVLDLVISEYLYNNVGLEEGTLSRLRSLIVCERSLARIGKKLKIGAHLALGRGEEQMGVRQHNSVTADAMEAVIGAVFLDGGFDAAKNVVLFFFGSIIDEALSGRLMFDFKTEIQELLQAKDASDISYRIDKEVGPDHNKLFYASLWTDGIRLGRGRGKTKKEAEQNAAKAALENMRSEEE